MPREREETVIVTPYRDGPLIVRGPIRLQDQDGVEIEVDRATIALCRCGRSRVRPFCDGSHKLTGFRAPSGLEQRANPDLRSRPAEPAPAGAAAR